jgi:transcriptional regulator with XRE-family HTH domain
MSRPTNEAERERFQQAVGGRIRTLRERTGWSQELLAGRAGLHRTFLGAVERGANGMSLDRLPDIAAALEVEPYALIPRVGSPQRRTAAGHLDRAARSCHARGRPARAQPAAAR